jgi:hypothetical protein
MRGTARRLAKHEGVVALRFGAELTRLDFTLFGAHAPCESRIVEPVVRQNVVIAEPVLLSAGTPDRIRTCLNLRAKDAPDGRPTCAASGEIIVSPEVGGLHHRYDLQAA